MKKDKLDIILEFGIGIMVTGWSLCVLSVGIAFMYAVLQYIITTF
tara:strand:- start:379 stop:513 length:135 start_codon:yes stop_codon:yes gene_type:complete